MFSLRGFPGGSVVTNLPVSTGDAGSTLGQEDPLEEKMASEITPMILARNPLQYSCLENPTGGGAW